MENFGQPTYTNHSPNTGEYKLKWHKFLIYFSLWASALLTIAQGYQYLSGGIYNTESARDTAYATYHGLQTFDIIFGILQLCLAAYILYTRFQLAGWKLGAPNKLYAMYIADASLCLLVAVAMGVLTNQSLSQLAEVYAGSLIMDLILLFANQSYYGKRIELFVN